jgi:lysozyme family protein
MTRFEWCVKQVLDAEGNATVTNDPDDPGGLTKFGISQRAYPLLDIANLTRDEAVAIYARDYWQAAHCVFLPEPIDFYVFDSAVNQGAGYAVRQLQEVLGVSVDGVFGRRTRAAVNDADRHELGALFMAERALDYAALAKFSKYGRGWLKRLFLVAAAHS